MNGKRPAIFNFLLLQLPLLFFASEPPRANWELAKKWSPDEVYKRISSSRVTPQWIEASNRFWYIHTNPEGNHYWLVDPVKKTRPPLFDKKKLAQLLLKKTGEKLDPKNLYFENMMVTRNGKQLSFDYKGSSFQFNIPANKLTRLPAPSGHHDLSYLNRAPNGQVGVFQKGNNLCLQRLSDGSDVVPITSDGEKGYGWGSSADLVENDDSGNRPVDGVWSPDSSKFCVFRMDVRAVPDQWLVDHLAQPLPRLKTYKATCPGGKVPQWELWILDIPSKKMLRLETAHWQDQTLEDLFIICQWWSNDSTKLYFTRRHRDYTKVDLCVVDMATGQVNIVVEERSQGQVYIKPLVLLRQGKQLLWWSQRTGHGHFYTIDTGTQAVAPVTQGAFNTDEFIGMEDKTGAIYLMCNGREPGRNPYYKHLYQVNPQTGTMVQLTLVDANHSVHLSPDKRFFIDNFSRADLPSRSVLRTASGQSVMDLERMDISHLQAEGWKAPEPFQAKSADGRTDLWGVMYKPFDLDPGKKYPIITRVYPGRMDEFIPHDFSPVSIESTLAQLGFIVVVFGNRGGCFSRGTEYREYGRSQFRDYGLADKKAVIEELGKRYAFIDINKVGIFGGSSGGFMTASAMLVYPDFFKVGVAATGPHDPGIYSHHWLERYKGVTLIANEKGDKEWKVEVEGNLDIAKNLQGKLLLIAGEQDDNVHPAHLFRLADALIKAGKTFDMLLIPGANHGLGDWRFYYGQVADYFAGHLLSSSRPGADILFKKQ